MQEFPVVDENGHTDVAWKKASAAVPKGGVLVSGGSKLRVFSSVREYLSWYKQWIKSLKAKS